MSGTITFLFDSGESFQEVWEYSAQHADESLARLQKLARARGPLLAANVRIVRLKVKGKPLERTIMKGAAGGFGWPRDFLIVRQNYMTVRRRLRGFPREMYRGEMLTQDGLQAFSAFNRTLAEIRAIENRKGMEPLLLTALTPDRFSILTAKTVKKATLTNLVKLLGDEEGRKMWEGLKAKKQ